ncbi:MAG: hypothetical protein LBJ64_03725 [Deltaproteobacteria bacterium]|nr:hypothetical protein [Deltaproteobacteria bacterium]
MAKTTLCDEIFLFVPKGAGRGDETSFSEAETASVFSSEGDCLRFADEIGSPFAGRLFADAGFSGSDNLVFKTIRAYRRLTGWPEEPVGVKIKKRIPLGAGLGGGSSDAAAVLKLLDMSRKNGPKNARSFGDKDGLSRLALSELAASLGGDVPFFLEEDSVCVARGIGERLFRYSEKLPGSRIILVNPGLSLSTASVFLELGLTTSPGSSISFSADLGGLDSAFGRNDLEGAAVKLCPAISEIKAALSAARPAPSLVGLSGSGPTCWALYEDEAKAFQALASLDPPSQWWVKAAALA